MSFWNFQQPQVLQLKLRKPKNKREVKWTTDTVDNEHMNKKKSKCKFMLSIKFFQLSVLINAAGRNMQNYYIVFQVYKPKTAEGKYVLHVLFSDKNLKNKKMLCRTFIYVSEGLIFMYLFVIVFHISGCCIYEKPKMFDESSSDDSDDECRSCRGHKDKCFRTDKDDDSGMWYYTIQSKQHFYIEFKKKQSQNIRWRC